MFPAPTRLRFTARDEQALRGLARNPGRVFFNGLSAEGKRRIGRLIDMRLAVVAEDGTCAAVHPAPPAGGGWRVVR
jgi:hypothetical protein